MKPTKRGFTVVEILIVLVIIGLLSAMVISAVQKIRESNRTPQQIEAMSVAKIVIYKAERVKTRVKGRANTHYYLIAADGTGVEVKLSEFARAQVGEPYKSDQWSNVD